MSLDELALDIEGIADRIREGKIVPFIGAGASQRKDRNCPPAGKQLHQLLAKKLKYVNGLSPLKELNLSTVAQHFQLQLDRTVLIEALQGHIGKDEYLPSPVQSGLARISEAFPELDLIITTNYDNLMEQALGDPVNRAHDVLIQFPDRPGAPYTFSQSRLALYKLHGSFDKLGEANERDSLVITDDDYIEFLSKMQVTEFIPSEIRERISNKPFLFLGYGLQDWNFMVLYKSVIESKNRSKIRKSYTIQKPFNPRGPDREYWLRFRRNTREYWQDKNIYTLEIDQDAFIKALLEKLGLNSDG